MFTIFGGGATVPSPSSSLPPGVWFGKRHEAIPTPNLSFAFPFLVLQAPPLHSSAPMFAVMFFFVTSQPINFVSSALFCVNGETQLSYVFRSSPNTTSCFFLPFFTPLLNKKVLTFYVILASTVRPGVFNPDREELSELSSLFATRLVYFLSRKISNIIGASRKPDWIFS